MSWNIFPEYTYGDGLIYFSKKTENMEQLNVRTNLYLDGSDMFCIFANEADAVIVHSYVPKTCTIEEQKYIPHIYNPWITARFTKNLDGKKPKYSIYVNIADYDDYDDGRVAEFKDEEDFVKTMREIVNWMRDFNRHLFTYEEIWKLMDKMPVGEGKWRWY